MFDVKLLINEGILLGKDLNEKISMFSLSDFLRVILGQKQVSEKGGVYSGQESYFAMWVGHGS